jgi:integrase
MKLPRYLMSQDGGYRYNPPADAVEAGIVRRQACGTDQQQAFAYAEEQNALMDEWRKDVRYLRTLSTKSTVADLVRAYKASIGYTKLSPKSQEDYAYFLSKWYGSKTSGTTLLHTRMGDLVTPICQRIYDEQASHSVSLANHALSIYRLLFSFAIRNGYTLHNPFTNVAKQTDKPRRVVWQKDNIKKFMDTAFAEWRWRNVGLIVYMAYEWGQRLGDMRLLTWDSYDVETGTLSLEQSKRRARVSIPTSESLQEMLKQQHEEFGWQKYIVPTDKADGEGGLKPYTRVALAKAGATIMQRAELPAELMMMDLRRTAVTEMIEAGVPLPNVMSITGHATPHSLSPYIKNTLKSATVAQNMRGLI